MQMSAKNRINGFESQGPPDGRGFKRGASRSGLVTCLFFFVRAIARCDSCDHKPRSAKSTHHPHKIDDQHREFETGGGAYFAFLLGSSNSHPRILPDEEGLLWGWCVVGGPLKPLQFVCPRSTRETDGMAAKLLLCGIASCTG